VFVINPVSGPVSRRVERTERVQDFIRQNRLNATLAVSRRGGHAAVLAREAVESGAELVVSVGGDGTMNEVARAVAGSTAIYGMIPCGSGNGLARDLGIPLDFHHALGVLLGGRVREIDSGEVNGLPFFNVMGLGLDAEIGRRFNLSKRRGFFNYLRIGVSTYLQHRAEPVEIVVDGRPLEPINAYLAAVANSTQYGNDARIAPAARLDDGRLDLAVITRAGVFSALAVTARLFFGRVDRLKSVVAVQGREFVIRRAAAGPVHTDGEVHECEPELRVTTRPRSLRVLVPEG